MRIEYSVSLWNFTHYSGFNDVRELLGHITSMGYGVETNSYVPLIACEKLAHMADGLPVSMHTVYPNDWTGHRWQIDTAAGINARTIVLHSPDIAVTGEPEKVNVELARRIVDYAGQKGIRIALENGRDDLSFLVEAADAVEGLGVCLDTGHVYKGGKKIADYLDALKHRLIHLHLQDVRGSRESGVPLASEDHYVPGSGGIPENDWRLVARVLREIRFEGIGVLEIKPRNPFQNAACGRAYFERILSGQTLESP